MSSSYSIRAPLYERLCCNRKQRGEAVRENDYFEIRAWASTRPILFKASSSRVRSITDL